MESIKIEGTSFTKEICEKMSFKEFKQTFEGTYKGKFPLDVVYKKVTGKNPPSKSKDATIRKTENDGNEG